MIISDSPRTHAAAPSQAPPVSFYDPQSIEERGAVGSQLIELLVLMRREINCRMSVLGLTEAQWRPLWALRRGQASTPHALAAVLGVDAGATTRMLDRLEAKGLVVRERSASDRRSVQLSLTPAGREAVGQAPALFAQLNNEFLRGVSRAEWQSLCSILDRMIANGQAMAASAGQREGLR